MSPQNEWGKGFVMAPGWLMKKQPSPNAVMVYIHLGLHGKFNPGEGRYDECRPSKKTLSKGDLERGYPGCGLSEQVIGRALRELETLGAIKGTDAFDAKGGQLPTVYRLIFGELHEEETAAQTRTSPVTPPSRKTKKQSTHQEETAAQTPTTPVIPPSCKTKKQSTRQEETAAQTPTSPVIPPRSEEPPGGYQPDTPRGVSDPYPGGGIRFDTQTRSLELEPKNKNPPFPPAQPIAAALPVAQPGKRGDCSTPENPSTDALTALVRSLTAASGWPADVTREVLETLRGRGIAPAEIARVMSEVAHGVHGVTASPRRMLTWWPTGQPADSGTAPPPSAVGSRKHLNPGTAMCRAHPGEPAAMCGRCRAEVIGITALAPDYVPPPDDAPPPSRSPARMRRAAEFTAGRARAKQAAAPVRQCSTGTADRNAALRGAANTETELA